MSCKWYMFWVVLWKWETEMKVSVPDSEQTPENQIPSKNAFGGIRWKNDIILEIAVSVEGYDQEKVKKS